MKIPFGSYPIVFFLSLVVLFSCSSVKEPDFKAIENVRVSRFGAKESSLNLDILYHNPNKFRVKLKRAEGDAWLDSNYLGHFIIDSTVRIEPASDFRLPVTLQMDMTYFFQNTAAIFLNKEVLVKIEGKAKLSKGAISARYSIHYEGMQNLSKMVK